MTSSIYARRTCFAPAEARCQETIAEQRPAGLPQIIIGVTLGEADGAKLN